MVESLPVDDQCRIMITPDLIDRRIMPVDELEYVRRIHVLSSATGNLELMYLASTGNLTEGYLRNMGVNDPDLGSFIINGITANQIAFPSIEESSTFEESTAVHDAFFKFLVGYRRFVVRNNVNDINLRIENIRYFNKIKKSFFASLLVPFMARREFSVIKNLRSMLRDAKKSRRFASKYYYESVGNANKMYLNEDTETPFPMILKNYAEKTLDSLYTEMVMQDALPLFAEIVKKNDTDIIDNLPSATFSREIPSITMWPEDASANRTQASYISMTRYPPHGAIELTGDFRPSDYLRFVDENVGVFELPSETAVKINSREIPRPIIDRFTVIHEMMHAEFERRLLTGATEAEKETYSNIRFSGEYGETNIGTLDEGLATLTELVALVMENRHEEANYRLSVLNRYKHDPRIRGITEIFKLLQIDNIDIANLTPDLIDKAISIVVSMAKDESLN